MATVITGLFETAQGASSAVRALEAKGIHASQISLVASEDVDRESFAIDTHSKLPEGVALGAGAGGALGALVAGFTAVGAIATGGIGIIAAGPVIAALAGAGAGAAGGGTLGGLIGAMIPEHEVKHYQDALGRGGVMVGVECDTGEQKQIARETFKHYGAERVSHA